MVGTQGRRLGPKPLLEALHNLLAGYMLPNAIARPEQTPLPSPQRPVALELFKEGHMRHLRQLFDVFINNRTRIFIVVASINC